MMLAGPMTPYRVRRKSECSMSYQRLKKSKRSLESVYRFFSNLLKQRLRGPAARTIRILKISEGETQQTNEAQFDPLWIDSELLRNRLGVVVRPVTIGQALRMTPAALGRFDVLVLQLFFRTPAVEVEQIIDTLRSRSAPAPGLSISTAMMTWASSGPKYYGRSIFM